MKILFKSLLIIFVLLINYKAFAVTHESCSTWIYSSYYSTLWSCNTCWYYNFRFYKWNTYWTWDFFENVSQKEYLMSTNNSFSYAKIHNSQANINYTLWNYVWSNTSWLTANWIPSTAWINGNKDTVIFVINNISWNQNIINRDIPIWIIEYNLRHYEVMPSWTSTVNTNYAYLNWNEYIDINWLLSLNTFWVNSSWIKNYNPTVFDHKECYVMLWAWCWDSVISHWETCDDWNNINWDWCSSVCLLEWWGWGWGWGWWWWWISTSCWDWNLDRPNDDWVMEECDFWSWIWDSWCDSNCWIIEDTDTSWATIWLSPKWNLLIWDWMKVFDYTSSTLAQIKNNSTSDIYIDKPLCVYKKNPTYDVLDWIDICSTSNIWYLSKLWWTKTLSISDDQFIWNISSIPTGTKYADSQIITTLEWLQDTSTFLKSILNVRVARPSVNTIWWWASLIAWINFSDINILSNSFWLLNPIINKNLILSSLWIWPLSSYVKTSSNTEVINKSKEEWNKDLVWFDDINIVWSILTINTLPTEKYNWFDNIFIHNWNVNLSSQNITWWNKTYIIENWNLTINWNITSNDNILFVVKWWWNLIIKNTVNKIDGIIINIWWDILWDITSTLNKLLINWALYGKVDDLLRKRTYIKDRWEYVDVWTTVNFTSKIFDSPPPLLSKFLWEYSQVEKIPK